MKVTIITATYNAADHLEDCIRSIRQQDYKNIEHIIVDGKSSDNTVEIIKKYEKHFSYWISENDTGQPSAINKGLRKCTGEIFNWLNSDDYLEKGALYYIAKAFIKGNADVVAGKVRYFDENGFEEIIQNNLLGSEEIMCWKKSVRFIQPGVWMKLKNLLAIDGVDEDMKMRFAFDWDMMVRYLYFFNKVEYIIDILVHYRLHPISNTVSDPARYITEEEYIIQKLNANPKYRKLHTVCSYKTNRRNWNNFLQNTSNNKDSSFKKVLKILFNLNKQPWQNGVPRMTAGAIKQILLKNKDKTRPQDHE